jgi:preprotein translocase subunit Sec61beta
MKTPEIVGYIGLVVAILVYIALINIIVSGPL